MHFRRLNYSGTRSRELRERNQFRGIPMEILFPAARCPLAGTPLLQTISLWIFPSRNPLPFRPIRNPLPSLFLNKFSCAISDNYRPTMNIHNDPTLVHEFSVFLVSGGRVCSRKGGVGSREMVLIGSRIANESLKLALVTCSFRKETFLWSDGVEDGVCTLGCVLLLPLCRSCRC